MNIRISADKLFAKNLLTPSGKYVVYGKLVAKHNAKRQHGKHNMQTLIAELKARQSVYLVGPPGCAKTARILATAKACSFDVVTWRASLMESVDVSGCIIPDTASGTSAQLPFADVKALQSAKRDTLLFIDDLPQAPTDVQAALMRLFDNQFFPANVVVWGAGNRQGDKAGANSLCEPLRSRFNACYVIPTPGSEDKPDGGVLLGTWKDEVDQWIEWAMDNQAPAEIIAWHRSTSGKYLYQHKPCADSSIRMCDYRSWGALIPRWNLGLRSLSQVSATIGKPDAAMYLAFAGMMTSLPCPDQVWLDPDGAPVPSEPSAQWLIVTSLAAQVTAPTAPAFIRYLARLPRMMTALGAKDAYRKLGAKLSGCREWVKWFTDNQALFS